MTQNANSQEHNQERDAALSALYHSGEQHEPPDHIEDEILAAARKEVRAGPRRRTRMPTSSPWFIPMATAAVLVLSISIVMLMRQQSPENAEPTRIAKRSTLSEPLATTKSAAPQSVFGQPLESLAERQENNTTPLREMEEERPQHNNDMATAGAMAGAKKKDADAPRVARFIGAKREAAGVGGFASAPSATYAMPDDWLREIARLRHIGEKQLAEAELKKFKEMNETTSETEINAKLDQFGGALSGDISP